MDSLISENIANPAHQSRSHCPYSLIRVFTVWNLNMVALSQTDNVGNWEHVNSVAGICICSLYFGTFCYALMAIKRFSSHSIFDSSIFFFMQNSFSLIGQGHIKFKSAKIDIGSEQLIFCCSKFRMTDCHTCFSAST